MAFAGGYEFDTAVAITPTGLRDLYIMSTCERVSFQLCFCRGTGHPPQVQSLSRGLINSIHIRYLGSTCSEVPESIIPSERNQVGNLRSHLKSHKEEGINHPGPLATPKVPYLEVQKSPQSIPCPPLYRPYLELTARVLRHVVPKAGRRGGAQQRR